MCLEVYQERECSGEPSTVGIGDKVGKRVTVGQNGQWAGGIEMEQSRDVGVLLG